MAYYTRRKNNFFSNYTSTEVEKCIVRQPQAYGKFVLLQDMRKKIQNKSIKVDKMRSFRRIKTSSYETKYIYSSALFYTILFQKDFRSIYESFNARFPATLQS